MNTAGGKAKPSYVCLLRERWPGSKLQHWRLDLAERLSVRWRTALRVIPKKQHRLVCINFGTSWPLRFIILKKIFSIKPSHLHWCQTAWVHVRLFCFTLCCEQFGTVLFQCPANQSSHAFKNTNPIMIFYGRGRNIAPEETCCVLGMGPALSVAKMCHSTAPALTRGLSQAALLLNCTVSALWAP